MKRYDRAYFDKWYRSARTRVNSSAEIRRKVQMSVAVAEYMLRRPLRTVLDVGCGEGAWFTHLKAIRPRAKYQGVDPSDYVIERFGRARNIVKGSFADLASVDLAKRYDLVVCADVLHYLTDRDIRAGLPTLVSLAGCTLFLETLTNEEEIVGDLEGLIRRPPSWYRRAFMSAGLIPLAPYTWLAPAMRLLASDLELP
jgi:2-polyprenyl-3-methyl-5-hydroxy-6-metoxy-1,4-benzoquinol methylase